MCCCGWCCRTCAAASFVGGHILPVPLRPVRLDVEVEPDLRFCAPRPELREEREVKGLDGETYRFVFEQPTAPLPTERDRPIQLSHVVLNSKDADAAERFAVEKLGFRLSDRTKIMSFVRCNRTHHCIAYARGGLSSLHHIAFEMAEPR